MTRLLMVLLMSLGSGLAEADSVTVTDQNASLKSTRDEPIFNVGSPSDPLRLLRTLEWTVDGRRILVYPSGPSTFLDVGHFHSGAHVTAQQIHAQGPHLGFAINEATGTVTGGLVYSLSGDAAGSGRARLSEKLDVVNKTSNTLTVSLAGLGFRPSQPAREVPDLSGLELKGTTVVFTQGTTGATSLTDPPYGPVTVRPVVNFTGFNPLWNQSFGIPAGGTLTMVTELTVGPEIRWITRLWPWWLLGVAVLLGASALTSSKRAAARRRD
jgi:hypothetical protein